MIARWVFNEKSDGKIENDVHDEFAPYILKNERLTQGFLPEIRTGISSSAVWLDGYSDYIESAFKMPSVQNFSISAWIALRTYTGYKKASAAIINQCDFTKQEGFFLGITGDGCLDFQVGTGNKWVRLASDFMLNKSEWHHIQAFVSNKEINLYVNGKPAAKAVLQNFTFKPASVPLLIGKNNCEEKIENVFIPNMFSGLINEITLSETMNLPEDKFIDYDLLPKISEEQISLDRNRWKSDPHRPQFHASPPGHWMNEPHAPFYYKGKYHLFYQHNPQGPFWGNIHWGHWVSEDLVNWKDTPVALAPSKDDIDTIGTWSGSSSFDENGDPVLFFTAGNDAFTPNQMIGLAKPTVKEDEDLDLKHWIKHPESVLQQPKCMDLHHDGFRDPFVWKEGDQWYQLVGSGFENKGGTIPVFTSKDLIHWEFRGSLIDIPHEKYPYLGEIWELPILLPISNEKHILFISPIGKNAEVEIFYWLGKWSPEHATFSPDSEQPKKIDLSTFHFTGPSAMVDPKSEKIVLFSIAQGERSMEKEFESGWAHTAGMPVMLSLAKDGELSVEPVESVASLRNKSLLSLNDEPAKAANVLLQKVKGDMLEIMLEVETEKSFDLIVRKTPDGEEQTVFSYNADVNSLSVNRTKATLDASERTGGIQGGTLSRRLSTISIRLLLDKSLLEAYINKSNSLTTRVYPSRSDALGIEISGPDDLIIHSLQIWEMKSIYY